MKYYLLSAKCNQRKMVNWQPRPLLLSGAVTALAIGTLFFVFFEIAKLAMNVPDLNYL
jgi:hypothetical protein